MYLGGEVLVGELRAAVADERVRVGLVTRSTPQHGRIQQQREAEQRQRRPYLPSASLGRDGYR
jgi:hypothetical protein